MNGISHKQAVKWIYLRLDGMLKADQAVLLDEHLEACESCRAYSQEIGTLPDYLNSRFKERWDTETNISSHIAQRVNVQARNIPMAHRFSSGMKLLAAVATLALFAFAMNFVISRWQRISVAATENTTATPSDLGGTTTTGLLAFTSDQDGNSEIYVMNPDGSGLTNITNNSAHDASPFWSPDGQRIAFTSDRDGSNQIYSMDADGSNLIRITNGDGSYGLDVNGFSPWSPDGTRLIVYKAAGEDGSKIYTVDVAEKTTTELTNDAGQYLRTSWSPDGTHIAFNADTGRIPQDLFVVGSDGSGLVKLTENLSPGEYFMFEYGWSQDGSALFFATNNNQQSYQDATYVSTVYKANTDGSIEVAARSTDWPILEWSEDMRVRLQWGSSLLKWVVADGSESTLKLCENTGEILGTAAEGSHAGNWMVGSNCSPNGWILYWTNPDGTIVEPLLESVIPVDDDILFDTTWSFDDQHIAFVTFNSTSVDLPATLYVLDVAKSRQDSSTQPLIIPNGSHPSWQPISNREVVEEKPLTTEGLLAFTSIQDGNHEIYTIHADGSAMTNITNDPAMDTNPYWSPDGKRIAFQSDRTGVWQIYVMEADGSNLVQLTKNNASHTLPLTMDFKADPWSPDGTTLLVLKQESGEDQLSLNTIRLDGTKETQLVTGRIAQFGISWSPDGNYIGYVQNEAQSDNPNDFGGKLYVVRSDASNAQDITDVFEPDEHLLASLYSWSADGQSISLVSYWRQQHIDETKVYEVRLNDHSVIDKYSTASILNDWPDEMNHAVMADSSVLSNWVRPNGTSRALDPSEHCLSRALSGSHINRSPLGNWVIIGYCPNGDHWLYWENADGTTIKQLINSPLSAKGEMLISFAWSPDDRHIAFNLVSPDKTIMYILDVNAALNDPSIQPEQVVIADSEFYTAPAWQPTSKREVVEEKPTPEPLAFSLTIEQAEEQAGFDVLEPSYLPEGYVFQGAAYNQPSNAVILQYGSSADDPLKTGVIQIFQKQGDFPELGLPSESHATPVAVGDVMGELTNGAWVYDSPDTTTPRWEESDTVLSLSWQMNGMSFSVDYLGNALIAPISSDEFIAIAESLSPDTKQLPSFGTSISNGEWIAFLGGNAQPQSSIDIPFLSDVYIMQPGTAANKLTHFPAFYYNLQWSPDGQHLLFERENTINHTIDILRHYAGSTGLSVISRPIVDPERYGYSWSPNSDKILFADASQGNYDIYTEYADGRNDPQLTQLTNDAAQDVGFAWSPDGRQIAFQRIDGDKLSIYIMNEDGSEQREIARGSGKVNLYWSQSGTSIYVSTVKDNWLDCEVCVHEPAIYRIDLQDSSVRQLYYEAGVENVFWYLYDTPGNALYFMRVYPLQFIEVWGTWFRVDGDSVRAIGEMDPHQTCQTNTGNTLNEYPSPNPKFSLIVDFCAGAFDLYLADHTTLDITHITRLPASVEGQGGNVDTIPLTWSPDGRWIIYDDGMGSYYLLNIELALQDPQTTPIKLLDLETLELDTLFDFTWQPRP